MTSIAALRRLNAGGMTLTALAEREGVSVQAISERFKKANVPCVRHPRRPDQSLLTKDAVAEICKKYQDGETIVRLSYQHKVSASTIHRTLIRVGIPRRSTGYKRVGVSTDVVATMFEKYKNGMSLAQVATAFERSSSGVRQLFIRDGYPLRPPGRKTNVAWWLC